jgi:hypothetical protein
VTSGTTHQDGRRNSSREHAEVVVDVREKQYRMPAEVVDFSHTGIQLKFREGISVGTSIWVKFPGFDQIAARVIWVNHWNAGCEFGKPLYPPIFEHLVSCYGRRDDDDE